MVSEPCSGGQGLLPKEKLPALEHKKREGIRHRGDRKDGGKRQRPGAKKDHAEEGKRWCDINWQGRLVPKKRPFIYFLFSLCMHVCKLCLLYV